MSDPSASTDASTSGSSESAQSPLPTAEGGSTNPRIREADLFAAPESATRAFPSLAQVDERIARVFAEELSHFLRTDIKVEVAESTATTQQHFAASIPGPLCLNYLFLEELGGHGLLVFDQAVLLRMLERLFGWEAAPAPPEGAASAAAGADDGDEPEPETPRARYSSIEEQVIRRLVHLFGRAMELAWRAVLPLTVRHLRIETNPESVRIASASDSIVCSAFRIRIGDAVGMVRYALPLSLLELHKPRFAGNGPGPKADSAERWREQLTASVREVEVDLVAELGRVRTTMRDLLGLKVGDVVRLSQAPGQPCVVSIGGLPKYRGQPTVCEGNLAIELKSLFDPDRFAEAGATLLRLEDMDP